MDPLHGHPGVRGTPEGDEGAPPVAQAVPVPDDGDVGEGTVGGEDGDKISLLDAAGDLTHEELGLVGSLGVAVVAVGGRRGRRCRARGVLVQSPAGRGGRGGRSAPAPASGAVAAVAEAGAMAVADAGAGAGRRRGPVAPRRPRRGSRDELGILPPRRVVLVVLAVLDPPPRARVRGPVVLPDVPDGRGGVVSGSGRVSGRVSGSRSRSGVAVLPDEGGRRLGGGRLPHV